MEKKSSMFKGSSAVFMGTESKDSFKRDEKSVFPFIKLVVSTKLGMNGAADRKDY